MARDRKKKKVTKYRGSKTHGGGSMKKRRGAGHRGGRGRAGSGKKADQKKPSYWKKTGSGVKGKKGFYSVTGDDLRTINISQIAEALPRLESAGKVSRKGTSYEINLTELGYDKLLGAGKTDLKLNIVVNEASGSAVEKVKSAGGSVELSKQKK